MTGGAKHNEEELGRVVAQRCAISPCRHRAIASCFECERLCCARHLTVLSLAIARRSVRVRVCPACLRRYRIDPEIQRLLIYSVPIIH